MTARRSASPTTEFAFELGNALAINPATLLHDGTWAVIFFSWHILQFCAVDAMTSRRFAFSTTEFAVEVGNALAINPATLLHDGTLQKLQPNLSR